ncbi:techylectin-5B-like [Haliotis rubra]|uniref:techylectin-5B-like n=1 Tax=Haliotis rubra TaxID=36100 RepID=UPI001EE58770|nr:techylectin-5B-like [Haliotis rubra]
MIQVLNRCMNGGEYDQDKLSCQCYGGYVGQFCERIMQDGLYTMTYERSWGSTFPEKHGGDCLAELKGQPFSTFDRDNDDSPLNCAQEHQSGFWFKNCTPCNPNGVWSETPDKMRAGVPWEMFWTPVTGDYLILSCFAF